MELQADPRGGFLAILVNDDRIDRPPFEDLAHKQPLEAVAPKRALSVRSGSERRKNLGDPRKRRLGRDGELLPGCRGSCSVGGQDPDRGRS